MASKHYCQKYRRLKRVFEDTYQNQISDISWYRLTAQLKRFMDFKVTDSNAEAIVRNIACMKRSHRNFRVNSENFAECWQLFQHYYQQKTWLTCAEFLADLAQKLDLNQVSRTSRYNWFVNAGIPYKAEKKYQTSDFALVAFQAAKCLKSRELKRVENAVITINSLVTK
jgi:quinolinate synthase